MAITLIVMIQMTNGLMKNRISILILTTQKIVDKRYTLMLKYIFYLKLHFSSKK